MTSRLPATDGATLYRRSSFTECARSSPSNPPGSKNAVLASSKETPCLATLLSAFLESHSNIALCIYQTRSPRKPRLGLPAIHNPAGVHTNLPCTTVTRKNSSPAQFCPSPSSRSTSALLSSTLSCESRKGSNREALAEPFLFCFSAMMVWLIPIVRSFPTHPLADIFYPPYPPIASQSISRDMPLAQARISRIFQFCPKGSNRLSFAARIERQPLYYIFPLRAG